jgi:ATP-dependent DNA ligase
MLAKATSGIPADGSYIFEPKWDGFRCIIFRDGDEVELGSRNEKPLTRYFPELVEAVKANLPERCVLDGEIVIVGENGLEFDALQQRIHPAASRIKLLSEQTPASFVAFDLLALDDKDWRTAPFADRRQALEQVIGHAPPIYLTPATTDRNEAERWFKDFEGAGLDGVVAKATDLEYAENKRVMLKIKHERTADCVAAGFRWHKSGDIVGSLLLGLFDESGVLHHVGITASFTMVRRRELLDEIAPLRMDDFVGHPWAAWASADDEAQRKPGAVSRWNAKKDLSWVPLRPDRVVEVAYDHLQGDRFRHATTFKRWRDDRMPESCTYDQLEVAVPYELKAIFNQS